MSGSGDPVVFEPADRPLISVVMVTYGAWPWARRALEAVAAYTAAPFEVIVVDNASPDGTAARLRGEVRGATLVGNDTNIGFGAGSNLGAHHARAPFLCLLNSDAMVQPGWLEPLLEALAAPDIAAAVPCLLGLDGAVQEAGSVLGAGGYTLAYGRGASPDDPAVGFPRRIDYGSAACMVLRRADFEAVGGFHPAYGLGYCEDVDLCLELAARGRWTVYEPRSRVVHVGAASSDHVQAGERMRRNRVILRHRWGGELSLRPPLADLERFPHRLAAARDATSADRIVVLTAGDAPGSVPGWIRALGRRLRPGGRVALAHAGALTASEIRELSASGVEVAPAAPEGWLRDRTFHFTAAIAVGPAAAVTFAQAIDGTQPQALRAYATEPRDASPDIVGTAPEAHPDEVAWIRRSEAVIGRDPVERRLVDELAPAATLLPAPPPDGEPLREWLDALLARLRVAPAVGAGRRVARGPLAAVR
jgi:O-antigen biosynthesis protein